MANPRCAERIHLFGYALRGAAQRTGLEGPAHAFCVGHAGIGEWSEHCRVNAKIRRIPRAARMKHVPTRVQNCCPEHILRLVLTLAHVDVAPNSRLRYEPLAGRSVMPALCQPLLVK